MKNIPYIKKYNANGEVTNKIIDSYENKYPNRKTKRYIKKNKRPKSVQIIKLKDGKIKTIKHYL